MAPPACSLVSASQTLGHARPSIQKARRQGFTLNMSSLLAVGTLSILATLLPVAAASILPQPTPIPMTGRHEYTQITAREEHERLEGYQPQALRKRDETFIIETIISDDSANESSGGAASTTVVTSPLPSPFDGSLAANFKGNDGNGACPRFVNSFLTDPTFKDCYPFSLLVQGSQAFFEAEKSAVAMTQILQVSCGADVATCAPYLENLSEKLLEEGNCLADYELENKVVHEAYNGLVAYKELYAASCLKDPTQGGFCFTNAVTNYTTPSNAYLYLLPLNLSMPDTASLGCDWCVKNTMDIYQAAAADRTLPIADRYAEAAAQVNTICGANFVNATLPIATVEDSAGRARLDTTLAATAVILAILFQYLA